VAATIDPKLAALARSVVAQVAPGELPLFGAVSKAYARDPQRAVRATESKDEMLGFGVLAAAPLLTPIVISVAEYVLRFVGTELLKAAKNEGTGAIDRAVHGVAVRLTGPAETPQRTPARLTPEQLADIRAVAVERAVALKLSAPKAEQLADSLVASLALEPR
jgi:hypothetical protein